MSKALTAEELRAYWQSPRPEERAHTIELVRPISVPRKAIPPVAQPPQRLMTLEPPRPLSAINDDPVFETREAAEILGVSYERMKKWRQRGQGPYYIQYEGPGGSVHYALSALKAYRDGVPSYQLACVADDAAMRITEVVRGADLLKSTARQILLNRALGFRDPAWYHCGLITDQNGVRLAKRHDALSIRTLRQRGLTPDEVIFSELPKAC